MTRFLVATASVHTTAAACDYLEGRAGPEDTVVVASVVESGMDERDAGDATNVAHTRLVAPTVETVTREGLPDDVLPELATEYDADEVIVGTRRGDPEATPGLGGTAATLLVALDVPVVVVPMPDL